MSTSITSSTTPFSSLLLTDTALTAAVSTISGGTTVYTPSIALPNWEYPTSGRCIVQLSNTALTNPSNSLVTYAGLQESTDNSTWAAISVFTSSLLKMTDNAGTVAASTWPNAQVLLPPSNKIPTYYIRAAVTSPAGGTTAGGATGSVVLSVLI